MRQTSTLSHPTHDGLVRESVQVAACPCWEEVLPMLSPQSVWRCLDPYPAALLRCAYPFLPAEPRPHLTCKRCGALRLPPW